MYCVVQRDLEGPTVEQLAAAFDGVEGLTAADGKRAARHGFGVIAENLSEHQAQTLAGRLRSLQVAVEWMLETDLPALGTIRKCKRVDCLPEELTFYDSLQRARTVAWDQVTLVAVGDVGKIQYRKQKGPLLSRANMGLGYGMLVSNPDSNAIDPPSNSLPLSQSTAEEVTATVLEVHLENPILRLVLEEQEMHFHYLGERRTPHRRKNYAMVVQDLLTLSPRAVANRGALSVAQKGDYTQKYLNQNLFERELRWLLWWSRRGGETSA